MQTSIHSSSSVFFRSSLILPLAILAIPLILTGAVAHASRLSSAPEDLPRAISPVSGTLSSSPLAAPLTVPEDEHWASGFVLNGVNGSTEGLYGPISVSAVVAHGGDIYVGGEFATAGDQVTKSIAKWNGSGWESLAGGVDGPLGTLVAVNALAVDQSGNVYAAGVFSTAGGVAANYIAQWNGVHWTSLGSGVTGGGMVNALAVDKNGNLYAGGYFGQMGGVSASRIAKWNGTSWSALGSGMNDVVFALAAYDNSVYAGGMFTTAGGVSANHIARWDGGSWSALGSGMGGSVISLAVDGSGDLYAGGGFATAGGVSANHIAQWNGSSWAALGSGTNGMVSALAADASGNLYAGGDFTTAGGVSANRIAKWDKSSWSALGSGTDDDVLALAVDSGGNLFAGGRFTVAGGVSANRIAKWNGSGWSALGIDNSFRGVTALAVDASNLYVGGGFTSKGGQSLNHVARWNGSTWEPLGSGVDGYVSALAAGGGGNVYAGVFSAGGVNTFYVAKWNGSSWSTLGSGMNGGINALAVDKNGTLYAGGTFTQTGALVVNRIAKWDGSNWSALAGGVSGYSGKYCACDVSAVAALGVDANNNLYVGGTFRQAGGVSATDVAKWNGSNWQALGSGPTDGSTYYGPFIYALAVDGNGNVYVGGDLTAAGGVFVDFVAQWNGSSWSALGSGTNGPVSALAVDASGNLYAGGDFMTAGGASANHIAKWNGSSWSALGSGTNSPVYALAVQGTSVYAGGPFSVAGGKVSVNFAAWTNAPNVSNFLKLVDKNSSAVFTASEFTDHFSDAEGHSLAKIRITSLPDQGTLKLGATSVTVNQEIAAANLGQLNYTPATDWVGSTSFGWNGSDGTQYAMNSATVNMIVAMLTRQYFPFIAR